MVGEGGGEGLFRLGADAEVGVSFGKEDSSVLLDDIRGWNGEAPACVAIDEGDIDEDGLVVSTVVLGNRVDEAKLFGEGVAGVSEHRERQAVLAGHEVALAGGLRADGDHEGITGADRTVEIAPGLKLCDTVGTPAAAEKFDDQGTKGKEIGAAHEAAGSVAEGEFWSGGPDGEDAVLNAGVEELGDGALTNGQALGLHQVARVRGDLVELVLKANSDHQSGPKFENLYSFLPFSSTSSQSRWWSSAFAFIS